MSPNLGIATQDGVEWTTSQAAVLQQERSETDPIPDLDEALERLERELMIRALVQARGNQAAAARALRITDRIMGLRVRKYALDPRRFRGDV